MRCEAEAPALPLAAAGLPGLAASLLPPPARSLCPPHRCVHYLCPPPPPPPPCRRWVWELRQNVQNAGLIIALVGNKVDLADEARQVGRQLCTLSSGRRHDSH